MCLWIALWKMLIKLHSLKVYYALFPFQKSLLFYGCDSVCPISQMTLIMTINRLVWMLWSAENDDRNICGTGLLVRFCISYSHYPATALTFFHSAGRLNVCGDVYNRRLTLPLLPEYHLESGATCLRQEVSCHFTHAQVVVALCESVTVPLCGPGALADAAGGEGEDDRDDR